MSSRTRYMDLFSVPRRAFTLAGSFLRRAAKSVVGQVSWQPPGWLRASFAATRAHPRRAALVGLVLAAALAGSYAWTHRKLPPPPRLVHVIITPPDIPMLRDILRRTPLVIRFDASAAALALMNNVVPPELVRLEPATPGIWHWDSDRRLVFRPGGQWPAGQTLRVTIDPAALGPRVRLAEYRLETRTPDFSASFDRVEFYQNPKDADIRQVTATLLFTHAVDPAALARRLTAAMIGDTPVFGSATADKRFALTPGRHGREFFLRTVPLTLPHERDTLKMVLDAGLPTTQGGAPLEKKVTATVGVPAMEDVFWIKDSTTDIVKDKAGNPEQFLIVETSCLARTDDIARTLEIYALPADNPNRHVKTPEEAAHENGNADNDGDDDGGSSDGDDDDGNGNADREIRPQTVAPTIRDGRYHNDGRSDRYYRYRRGRRHADGEQATDPWAPSEVDAAALARSRRLTFTAIPSHDEQSTTHTFRLRADAAGSLFVRVAKDTPAPGGYKLRDDYTGVAPVPVPEPEISIQGDGGVLALTGERKLSVRSRGVAAIRYEIARVPASEINHLVSQTEGDFQRPEFRNGSRFNERDIARFTAKTQAIAVRNPVESNYSTFDFTAYLKPSDGLDREGLFFLTASGWDPQKNRPLRNGSGDDGDDDEVRACTRDARFVLVTDLGLLAKRNGDGSRDVFVASLATGAPLGGVEISVLARNGAALAAATTDAAGRASLPSLGKNPRDSREPVAIVARRGGDVSFLPYDHGDRTLDFSRFAIDGIENRTGRELDAFVFTERGVYRPGDTLHVGVVVKQRDWSGALDGVPLETEVVDARERPAQVRSLTLPASGFVEWTFDTANNSPTGAYQLNVYLQRNGQRGTLLGSTTVQVQEFQPDRLKLDVALSHVSGPGGHGWVSPENLRGTATLKNLYGTAASDRLVKAHLRLNPRGFAFKEFPDFTFYDRLQNSHAAWSGDTIQLGDQQTDDDGAAAFNFDLARFADVTYRLTFDAEGFEAEGGRGVEDLAGTLVSPLPYVVGWRADGDLGWITAGGPGRNVDFMAVDPALGRHALDGLTIHLAEVRYISVLTRERNGNYAYESIRREIPVHDEPAAVPAAGWRYALPHETPGTFVAELRDAEGLAISRFEYTVVGQGHVTRSLEKNAELQIKLSKEQYRAGEEVEIAITAPYAGSGLITLERERVYTHAWFKATGTSSVQRITIPPDFDGTGYVNVSFVRALDSREIFMSPLSYAVAPVTVNMERRRLGIELHAAEKVKPGEPLAIHYKADRPAKVAIFAVDQGILQVTKFPLPDPLAFQFRKSALTVRTSQIVDLLLPEFSILRAAQAVGGDGDPGVLNPFRRVTEKPVVYWSGIVDADATERSVTYSVPDYFTGTLTIMAVAVAPDAVASVKTNTLCRGAFVLTPGVPTLAAPGDEFEVGLTVANGQVGSGPEARIALQMEPGDGLQIVSGPKEGLRVPEGREASAVFRLRVLDRLGSTTLGFRASAGGEEARVHSTLSIRPAMPFRTIVASGSFRGGSKDVPVDGATLYPEYRKLDATVSALPLGLARGLERYLKEYPHGCSEQITSGAFARLALADVADLGLTRAEAAAQIAHTLNVQRQRQNDTGGFGFWDAGKTPDIDFITVYVMHFLSEARAAGYPVPDDMLKRGLEALRRCAAGSPGSLRDARVQAYALYVLSREGVVTRNGLLTLCDYLDTNYKARWPGDLAAVYMAGSWSLLKKDDEARRLISGYEPGHHDLAERWDFHDGLSADAQYLTILARHFPDRLAKISAREFEHVTRPIGEGDFSTLSAAYAVQALKAYSQAVAQNPPRMRVAALLGAGGKESPLSFEGGNTTLLRGAFPPAATALRFLADGGVGGGPGVFWQTVQSGFDHQLPKAAVAQGIEAYRELRTPKGGKLGPRIGLGDRVMVLLRLRATKPGPVTNVAVVDLIPGGFEVADHSLVPGTGTAGMDYVDVREDRAVFYGTLTNEVRTITYLIKPTARGEFTVPPIYAEGMYDKKLRSVGLGGHITVTAKP